MRTLTFEERYHGILVNIEIAIIPYVKIYPDLHDHDALRVVEAAIGLYKAKKANLVPKAPNLSDRELDMFETMKANCERALTDEVPKTIDEILLCLKRVQKSIQFWNSKQGSRGYLTYVSSFFEIELQ